MEGFADAVNAVVVPFPVRLFEGVRFEDHGIPSRNDLVDLTLVWPDLLVVEVVYLHLVPIANVSSLKGRLSSSPSHFHLSQLETAKLVRNWIEHHIDPLHSRLPFSVGLRRLQDPGSLGILAGIGRPTP